MVIDQAEWGKQRRKNDPDDGLCWLTCSIKSESNEKHLGQYLIHVLPSYLSIKKFETKNNQKTND